MSSNEKKLVGIIGITGRMGKNLKDALFDHDKFSVGPGFARSASPHISLKEVFEKNDYVIDFSSHELLPSILTAALTEPKPMVVCSTGWSKESMEPLLYEVMQKTPLIIAPNTSVGAYLQRKLIRELAKALSLEYDIDIGDKHHRNKVDTPSGTAMSVLKDIQKIKKEHWGLSYANYPLEKGPRPDYFIGMNSERSGNLSGEHEVTFVSGDEMISVKHVAYDRGLFSKGGY